MTLSECWNYALRLHVPQHAVDAYLLRTRAEPIPMAYEVDSIIRAEFVAAKVNGDLKHITEDGFPRVAAHWVSEPLVSFIKPLSEEGVPRSPRRCSRRAWKLGGTKRRAAREMPRLRPTSLRPASHLSRGSASAWCAGRARDRVVFDRARNTEVGTTV